MKSIAVSKASSDMASLCCGTGWKLCNSAARPPRPAPEVCKLSRIVSLTS